MTVSNNELVEFGRKKGLGKGALPPINPKEKPLPGGIYDKKKASAPFPKANKDFPNGQN